MRVAGAIVTLLFVASEAIPLLLYANRRSVCLVDVDQPQVNSSTIANGLEDAAAVDFVYESGMVYWTDVSQEAIKRSWLDGSHATESVVNHGLVSPDGLACDWVGRKIYWTDSETNRIEVSNLDGSFRKVLFWEDLDQPRAIAVDPLRGYVYWTDWGETAKIERAGMDGAADTRRTLISTDIAWPNGLTIDYDAGRIYWTDGKLKYIHSCKLDGTDRQPIVRNSLQHPYAITVFGDLLYWTDWQMRSIYACNKSSGEDRTAVVSNLFSPMDVRVFHSDRQPHGVNPCGSNNGGCSHLCLISPKFPYYRCACPTGIRQLPDNKTCAYGASEILLLARRTDLCWISLDTPDFTDVVVPLESIRHAIAVDYDPIDSLVYWTDDEARSIRRTNLNATREEIIIEGSISNPDGIAVDWIARNLYWTDSGTDRIEVSRLNGTSRKVLIATDLDEPRAIVVHPVRGLLFWTDWGAVPKIERSNLDGSDREVLVNTSLGWPNGLSIDHAAEKIYWADAKMDRIEMASFDGSTRTTLVSDKLPHVFGVSLLGDYLYWTDWQDRSIQRVHKSTGRQRRMIVEHLADLMGLKAVSIQVPEGSNECSYNNGNCSHLCLNRPAPRGHVCACPMGQELLADGQTCIVPEAFLLYSRGSDIRRLSLENSQKLSYGDALVPVPGVKTVRAIDFDSKDDRIYWTDVTLKSISRAFVNGSSLERLVEFGLETPDGLAIDWIAQNMYWTDSGTRRIEMSRLNGLSRKAIVWKDVIPIAVAVDPPNGYLYWSNWVGKPHIERSYLDGSRRQTIATDVGNVTALTIDYDNQRLYWTNVDRKLMESSKLDGSDRRPVVTGISHSMGIAQYDRFIFWTNAEARIIEKADKTTGQNRTTVLGRLNFVTSLSAFHSSRQSGWNECRVNNGGCSHLCIAHSPDDRIPRKGDCFCPNHRDFRSTNITCRCALHCACPTHYILAPDNATCQKPSSFLLYSRQNSTSRVLLGSEDNLEVVLPIQGMSRIRAIEFDPVNSFIYWIDDGAKGIYRVRDNGTDFSPVIGPGLAMQNGPVPYDLAIDPYARMLYWSDSSSNVISVSRLDGTGIGVIVREGQPRSIALAPEDGYLFWTSTAKVPKIKSSHLDGTTVSTLFSTGLGSLGAITVDVQSQKLFWVDLDLTKIECSDFGGGNRQTLVDDELSEPSGLAVFGNYLYWVDQPTKSLERVNKTNGRGHVRIVSGESEITDLVVVARGRTDPKKSPCGHMNGGCSHLCVVDKNAKNSERRCSCPMGLQLASDDHTCESPPTCNPDHFTCANGLCIPAAWQCDGLAECSDGSDESNCSSRCSPLQFRCDSGQCVQRKQRCDGIKACADGSDERNCPPCDAGQKLCVKDEVCISAMKWCNKKADCSDRSDESNCGDRRTPGQSGSATTMPYAIGIGIVGSVIIVVVFLVLIVCLCRQKSRMLAVVDDRYKIVLVAKPPNASSSQCSDSATRVTTVCCSQPSVVAQPPVESADAESTLYDRDNLTGASSTSSSVVTQYPQDLLNPPPSPATERSRGAVSSMYYVSKSKRAGRVHGLRPHRRTRKHVPPPPTTPCSTDVCDDSDPCSYRRRPFCTNPDFGYESDLLCPPPPTPRSHYLSGDLDFSCPPSPLTERSYFLPYPPPPPASVFSCSNS